MTTLVSSINTCFIEILTMNHLNPLMVVEGSDKSLTFQIAPPVSVVAVGESVSVSHTLL